MEGGGVGAKGGGGAAAGATLRLLCMACAWAICRGVSFTGFAQDRRTGMPPMLASWSFAKAASASSWREKSTKPVLRPLARSSSVRGHMIFTLTRAPWRENRRTRSSSTTVGASPQMHTLLPQPSPASLAPGALCAASAPPPPRCRSASTSSSSRRRLEEAMGGCSAEVASCGGARGGGTPPAAAEALAGPPAKGHLLCCTYSPPDAPGAPAAAPAPPPPAFTTSPRTQVPLCAAAGAEVPKDDSNEERAVARSLEAQGAAFAELAGGFFLLDMEKESMGALEMQVPLI